MSTMTRALTKRVPRPSNNPIMEATTQEEFEKLFGIAIAKAVNTQEVPVKEKHLRTLIIASYKEKGAGTFWINFIRLQIEGSPILSWKFCHVLHKLLNEGHKNCIADSLKYRSKINDLGKLWSHLKEGYGQLILAYCKLILTKLEFHHRNINVGGNLQLSDEQLEALGQHDVNTWFQLCVEMLDYVEDILALQRTVFNSLDMSKATSMTTSGQCKLAPLIICIQEASLLYDYLVKMMFKLYAALPPDILTGHQDRFNNLFKALKQFYYTSSNLQYFKYLVSIPTLPEVPPNFLIASDLKSYVTPQVLLHSDTAEHDATDSPPDNRSVVSVPLVDLNNDNHENKQIEESYAVELIEKDMVINSLKRDLGDVKATLFNCQQQTSQTMQKFQKQILELQKELLKEKSLVEQLEEENSHYRAQAEQLQNEKNQNTATRLEESEKKAQLASEKLKKMKDVYGKLREEHIDSLKKLANVQKDFECTRKSAEDFASEKNILETNYQELLRKAQKFENEKLQTASDNEQFSADLQKTLKELDTTRNDLKETREALCEEKNRQASIVAEMQTSLEGLSSKCKLSDDYYWKLFECVCNQCSSLMCDTLDQFDNPAHLGVTCSPEFVLSINPSCSEAIDQTHDALQKITASQKFFSEEFLSFSGNLINYANLSSELLIHGKATANAAPSNQVEKLENLCRLLASDSKVLFDALKSKGSWPEANLQFVNVKSKLEELSSLFRNLLGKMGDVSAEELGDMFEKEMRLMDKTVQEAASKIQEIMTKSKQECTGVRLEVNSKILDACTMLMTAVIELVKKSWNLQQEIVQDGRGTGSVKDFYKRHHQWTEGLVSAAKAVGVGAKVLVDSADRVISGQGKFEELIAASQEIAASTAQLVVSSKVKAEKNSQRMSELSVASRAVTSATANVLGTVKSGREIFEEKDSLDFSNLSLHQAKRTEMEVQVKVLELECALEKERKRLAEIRKVHYQLAGPAEGWEESNA